MECFNQVDWRKLSLKKKRPHSIVYGVDHFLCFPILLRGMGAGVARFNAMLYKEVIEFLIYVFTTIVTLKIFYLSFELIFDIRGEMKELCEQIRFAMK